MGFYLKVAYEEKFKAARIGKPFFKNVVSFIERNFIELLLRRVNSTSRVILRHNARKLIVVVIGRIRHHVGKIGF